MKTAIAILSESRFRRLLIQNTVLRENIEVLETLVNHVYSGRFTRLLYELLRGGSADYRNINHFDPLRNDYYEQLEKFYNVLGMLKRTYADDTCIVRYDGVVNYPEGEIPMVSELPKAVFCLREKYQELEDMQLHSLLLIVIDIFTQVILDDVESSEYVFMYLSSKLNQLELAVVY